MGLKLMRIDQNFGSSAVEKIGLRSEFKSRNPSEFADSFLNVYFNSYISVPMRMGSSISLNCFANRPARKLAGTQSRQARKIQVKERPGWPYLVWVFC